MAALMTEAELSDLVLDKLSHHFDVRREVWGRHHTGKRLRVDAVVTPLNLCGWYRGEPQSLALEFKKPIEPGCRENGRRAKLIAQAIDYRCTVWDGFGRLPLVVCPPFSPRPGVVSGEMVSDSLHWDLADREVMRVANMCGVFELRNNYPLGLWITAWGDQVFWSEAYGPQRARFGRLLKGVGSK